MIRSFADRRTERLFRNGECPPDWQSFEGVALRKLDILDTAADLRDLKSPGNQLEKLKDDRKGQHSIRINQKWRVCFRWTTIGPEDVAICDYH